MGYAAFDSRVVLLICCMIDGEGLSGGGSSGSESCSGTIWQEYIQTSTGRIDWSCQTRDGKRGQVRINGVHFDLEKGRVFLVSVRNGHSKIVQLERDISGVSTEKGSIESYVEKDPELSLFMEEWQFPQ